MIAPFLLIFGFAIGAVTGSYADKCKSTPQHQCHQTTAAQATFGTNDGGGG
jgi:hypothetical protein